jgi:hypothetical protein
MLQQYGQSPGNTLLKPSLLLLVCAFQHGTGRGIQRNGELAVSSFLVAAGAGIFFGLFYHFVILIPVTFGAAIVCCVAALLVGQSASAALLAAVIPSLGLQAGYMTGIIGRDLFDRILSRYHIVRVSEDV